MLSGSANPSQRNKHVPGYTPIQIGEKLDVSDNLVRGYLSLKNKGEERLLEAAVTGKIPIWVAVDISYAGRNASIPCPRVQSLQTDLPLPRFTQDEKTQVRQIACRRQV
jgi:hypothetical protein